MGTMDARKGIRGAKVLVIEDEAVVAMLLEQMLDELDCRVAGVAGHLSAAIDLARSADADVAILDLNLGGEPVDAVAEALAARDVPFVFASGYGLEGLPPAWSGRPMLAKPYRLEQLRDTLQAALAALQG